MEKPKKIAYDELIQTTTMFWINTELENEFKKYIDECVLAIEAKLRNINTMEGLKSYILNDKNSLNNILTLMEIPEEKFKRIISMLRRDRKYVFTSEWSLDKTRRILLENEGFMEEVCELFMNGSNSERFKLKIPDFLRESFKIDDKLMSRLADMDELRRLVKHQLDVKYNTAVANTVVKRIEEAIKLTCDLEGLTYVKDKSPDDFDKVFSFIIPNERIPRIIIDCSYNITTSSTQTNFAKKFINARKQIANDNKKIISVAVLEGAGWIGRQSDLKTIYDNADYVLNIANIGLLDQIIRYGMEA